MLIIKVKDYEEMSRKAADIISLEINNKSDLRLGLATGSTPLGMYKELIKAYKDKRINFSKVHAFMFDEYYPISKRNKNSYYYYTNKEILNHVNIINKNIHILNGGVRDWKKECLSYEKKIKKNKIDLQILGVGVNGHIGFNEPGSSFSSKTRLVKLSESTRKINSRFFKDKNKVPKYGLTMGIGTIMKARKLILLASGKNKAVAIKHLIEGSVDKKWPVSALRNHKNLVLIIDEDAERLLR